MRPLPNPSSILGSLINALGPSVGQTEVTMNGEAFDQIVTVLMKTREMTIHLERETGALRLAEASRITRKMIDELATDQFVGLVVDPEGKVIRPDFRKKGE